MNATRKMTASKAARLAVAVAAVAALVAGVVFLPLQHWALALVDWIRAAGAVGVLVYALVYIAATLLFLPGSLLTAGAGFAYGPVFGTLLVSPVSVAAALLAFFLRAIGWAAAWQQSRSSLPSTRRSPSTASRSSCFCASRLCFPSIC